MTESMKAILVVLRQQVNRITAEYNKAHFDHAYRASRRDTAAKGQMRVTQTRLAYLVPLLRALHAAAQQSVTGGDAGQQLYRRKFHMLRQRMREVLCGYGGGRELYFGGGIADLEVLIPQPELQMAAWPARRIGDLLEDVTAELSAERRERLAVQQKAEDARKAFIKGLTAEQRRLLADALAAAKLKGHHAVSFDQRDLA